MLTPVGMAMLYRAYPPAQRARVARTPRDPDGDGPGARSAGGRRAGRQPLVAVGVLRQRPDRRRGTRFQRAQLREHRERAGERFDVPGFVLAAAGFGLFLYALSEAATLGLASPLIVFTAVAGVALIAVAGPGWSCTPAQPMIDFRFFRNRLFGVANLASLFASGGFLGLLFVAPIWLQTGPRDLGAGRRARPPPPRRSECWSHRSSSAGSTRASGHAGWSAAGLSGSRVGPCVLALVMDEISGFFRAVMFAVGVGWAYVVISMNAGVFAQISPRDTGRASALYNAQRQLASALGVAALSTIIGNQTTARTCRQPRRVSARVLRRRGLTLVGAMTPLRSATVTRRQRCRSAQRRRRSPRPKSRGFRGSSAVR